MIIIILINKFLMKIYIRLIDGALVFVPVAAEKISEDEFRILTTEELDLDNDATAIWEFFPGDIVKCKKDLKRNFIVADKLISSDFPNRRLHQLIFKIVESLGQLKPEDLEEFNQEIRKLLNKSYKLTQKKHPLVKAWIERNS